MISSMADYHDLYLQTAGDLIKVLQQLKKISTSKNDKNTIFEFYRAAHSLKSQSLMMGYEQIGMTCRLLEALLRDIHDGKQIVSSLILADAEAVVDHLKRSLDQIKNKNKELDHGEDIKKLQNYISLEK
ncbi:hypothetical protein A3A93_05750 [Candidatus Roizmanbacteria bacterium RIFCSPLOWO2_01_FULL_38_12]|uniref:HPt domain-containing protein n=1 Tax=Candidatus Roizmanbacteria bacterium RIFCSPLOWO2_01_FULL_38_12 TaxID=1802061 RepID=A0A1F7IV84_9BACT|nr:MAG: hypothetical protein A3F59_03390 [Candidatus Roizmanbacteria bacterium RIFCSPHIGHO2_12_FULL_38_13]OGK47266.1 MAG: hypothetical protein A3A93_05750 [Candidatus Roizmanbacteria bacterium RIFCSPLOWO2_01_FULL_38_12]